MSTEADTCRKYVLAKLVERGWDEEPHFLTEQRTFIDGRIVVSGDRIGRKKQKRTNYLLLAARAGSGYPITISEI